MYQPLYWYGISIEETCGKVILSTRGSHSTKT